MAFSKVMNRELHTDTKIDLSPMIDCVFILLIFFIVTTVFVEESGITANKLEINGAPPTHSNADPLELVVTSDGIVRYHGRSIDTGSVSNLVQQVVSANPEIPVLIEAEAGVSQQLFAQVYGDVKAGGASLISFK